MSKFRTTVRNLTVALGLGAAVVGVAPDASACGGAYIPVLEQMEEVDHRPMGITIAEKQLEKGDHVAAAATVVRVMPHIAQLDGKKSKLVERAQRVLAVSVARNGGSIDFGYAVPKYAQGTWSSDSAEDKQSNLKWAVSALRSVNETHENDPEAQTELAEALAKTDSAGKAEAKKILEGLAGKDLMASPTGYAALAQLRADAGDEKGRDAAAARCKAMARDARVCGATGTAGA